MITTLLLTFNCIGILIAAFCFRLDIVGLLYLCNIIVLIITEKLNAWGPTPSDEEWHE